MKAAILGYGNLGRGVECAIKQNPDMELAAEARRHAVEEDFCHAVAKARTVGMSDEEIKELFAIIIEE